MHFRDLCAMYLDKQTLQPYSVTIIRLVRTEHHVTGFFFYLSIFLNSWFHGKITRDQAEQVMSSASDGQFLIKESVNFPGDYVLFVW